MTIRLFCSIIGDALPGPRLPEILMADEKSRRIKKAVEEIHDTAQVKDATQLRGRVRIVTSATILKLINDIVDTHTGESDKQLLSKVTEAEFELLKLRKNQEILRGDLERLHEETLAKDATIRDLTEQLAQTLAMAERRESEVRRLSEMIQARDKEHAAQLKQLEDSIEKLKARRADEADTEELQQLREELSAVQSELRMSEDIEEMQRSEISNLEQQLENTRAEYEEQVERLSKRTDQLEKELHLSRELERKLRNGLTGLAEPKEKADTPSGDFGRTAVRLGYCTDEEVQEARMIQKNVRQMGLAVPKLGDVLLDKGFVTEGQLTEILRSQSQGRPRIEGYEFVSKLGEGLLGATYKARQLSLDREVAVKVIRREFTADKGYTARFLDRAKQAGRLHHKNIAHVIDAGESNEIHYCITEYVRGQNLREILRKKKRLDERQVLHMGLEVAYALSEAYRNDLVHGDIKPSNIIVNIEGVVKVCDFGLTRRVSLDSEFTLSHELFETVYYTAPEVVRGGKPDIRSDIYSLGATLFHITTGGHPFGQAATPREALLAHLNDSLPDPCEKNPELSQELGQIIKRMLEPQPEDRYQEPKEVAAAIVEMIKQRRAGSPSKHAPRRRHTRRRRM